MNYQASNPVEYPVGELVKMLPEDIRKWVVSQSLDTKTHLDIHQILLKGRREFGIPPWHIFTAVMQGYAAAAFEATGEHVDVSCSWFSCGKQLRPLDIFNHKYEDFHEIWVHTHAGEDIMVGYVVGRYDGRPVFSFWDVRTERYIMDCTKPTVICHPYTREPILSGYGLAKWRDHFSVDGRAILPEMIRRDGKKKRVRLKQKEIQPELPLEKPPMHLAEPVAQQRLMLLKMIRSVIDCRIVTDRVAGAATNADDRFARMCIIMCDALDMYISKLEKRDVTVVHIPDDVYLACQTTQELLKGTEGLGNAIQLWMMELLKTDPTRG